MQQRPIVVFSKQSRWALYQPIRKLLIITNSVRVNNSTTSHDPFLFASSRRPPSPCKLHATFCRQKYAIKYQYLRRHYYFWNFSKFWSLKILKIFQKFFGPCRGPFLDSGTHAYPSLHSLGIRVLLRLSRRFDHIFSFLIHGNCAPDDRVKNTRLTRAAVLLLPNNIWWAVQIIKLFIM